MNKNLTRVLSAGPAPSKERLVVRIDLGDKGIRTLAYDGKAMEWLRQKTGKNLLRGEFMPASLTDVVHFLYACTLSAQSKEGKLTSNELADSIHVQHVKEAFAICMKLLMNRAEDPSQLAPYVPTHPRVLKAALELAGLTQGETFLDLGCGDGRALALAHKRGATEVYGYELDANRARVAKNLIQQVEATGEVFNETIMTDKWLEHKPNVVFCYLLGDAMKALVPYLVQLPKGTRLLSHDFLVDDWEPTKKLEITADDRKPKHSLYLYVIGEHIERKVDFAKPISEDDAAYVAAGIAEALAELDLEDNGESEAE